MKIIVFTDLDETLLDKGYSFKEALPAIERLRLNNIPIVPISSKTRAEMEILRERIGGTGPFSCENGGAILIPKGYFPVEVRAGKSNGFDVIKLGRPYSEIRAALTQIRTGLNVFLKGFGDMSAEEISGITGLSLDEAASAKKREYDEPFIFMGAEKELETLIKSIESSGLKCTKGKLFHIHGDHDKGKAVRILKELFIASFGSIRTIALGDGPNDIPMLVEADYPVLLKRGNGGYEDFYMPGLIRTEKPGPAGWMSAINNLLDSIEKGAF